MTDPDGIHGNDAEERANCPACSPIAPPTDNVAKYVDLVRRKTRSEEALREINRQIADTEQALLAEFASTGTQSVKTTDGATIYVRRELSVETRENVDLRSYVGTFLPECLGPNWQKLKARLREILMDERLGEWVADDARLPEGLRAAISVREVRRIGCRGA